MNIAHRQKIILLGFLSHFPVAGVAWQTIHYLIGFRRLGYEVYYVEAHGCTPGKLMESVKDDGPARAAEYIAGVMRRFGLDGHWAYHAIYDSRCLGMSETQLGGLYGSAALIINLHGSHLPTPELTATNRLVYLGTDPVDIEIDVSQGKREAIDYLAPHCAFFTYGENLGRPGCLVPKPEPFEFRPTRQPVIMDLWERYGTGKGTVFTTVGNWRQAWRQVDFNGQCYKWSKHFEFRKFITLPRRVAQTFELALSGYEPEDKRLLEANGWRVRHALDISQDLDNYRGYIAGSRGEFTVAKDQNIRLRSGWFSDRAATYLAAGRPVVTQETGFSNILPTGEGLFSFSTMEEIIAAVEAINPDYERHRRAARRIAQECFSHDVVLGGFLRELGLPVPASRACHSPTKHTAGDSPGGKPLQATLPPPLVVRPVGRWPTRLPVDTVRTAEALPPPAAVRCEAPPGAPASIVVVTRDALAYTRMCLTSLFHAGWRQGDDLVVVDNASGDGTLDYLSEVTRVNPFVRVVLNEENRGFAAATNQGLALAKGEVLILLNNDTLVLPGWCDRLARWLQDTAIGLVGPVTNHTCNEAQVDAPYRTYSEMAEFATLYTSNRLGQGKDLRMLAMFCLAMRRDVFSRVGALDEQFEVGMFEDDDYAERVRRAGLRVVCAEDVFVHHFGQASLGELCARGEYDRVFEANRRRYETKWKTKWHPHARRITPEYEQLRQRVRAWAGALLPARATVAVVSKGDTELLRLNGCRSWHFPRRSDGAYAAVYPADSAQAIEQLEAVRACGAGYLLIPKPAFWWLEYYTGFREHLEDHYRLAGRDEGACLLFDLGGDHV